MQGDDSTEQVLPDEAAQSDIQVMVSAEDIPREGVDMESQDFDMVQTCQEAVDDVLLIETAQAKLPFTVCESKCRYKLPEFEVQWVLKRIQVEQLY